MNEVRRIISISLPLVKHGGGETGFFLEAFAGPIRQSTETFQDRRRDVDNVGLRILLAQARRIYVIFYANNAENKVSKSDL